jgi:hypothetical protein
MSIKQWYIYSIAILLFGCIYALTLPSSLFAATMSFSPSSANTITGCTTFIPIVINTNGQDTNGAQVYVSHTGLPGEVQLQSIGGAFDVYRVPDINPTPYLALRGYGGYRNGPAVQFARLRILSTRVGATINVAIMYDPSEDYTTRIARDGIDITTSVGSGTFTVVDGFCDTVPPQVLNLIPVSNEPNHPVAGNIGFDVTDNSSGVDLSTLAVTIEHDGYPGGSLSFVASSPELSATVLNPRDFRVVIDPPINLIPQTLVRITVEVSDRAGNRTTRSWTFNGLTCEQLGCGGETTVPIIHECNDGIDNNGNGLIDLDDPACRTESVSTIPGETIVTVVTSTVFVTVTSTAPGVPPGGDSPSGGSDTTIDIVQRISIQDLRFFLSDRAIQVQPSAARVVSGLVQHSMGIDVSVQRLAPDVTIRDITLQLDDRGGIPLVFDNTSQRYRSDITFGSSPQFIGAFIRIVYGDGLIDTIPFTIQALPFGEVFRLVGQDTELASGAQILLERYADGSYSTVTQIIAQNGRYGFIVPNGTYRMTVSFSEYNTQVTQRFFVTQHIINRSFTLRPQINLLDPEVPIEEKITFALTTAEEAIGTLRDVFNDPVVEERANTTVAPVAAAVTAAALVPALSALGLLNYLRFLFLQPLLLFGRKKRKGWGYVYNTLTRKPLDLVQVRLIDHATNRVVQSRVTDMSGRYIFFADPGTYRIEVTKDQFVFPTTLLRGEREDGPYLDIYHGEPIRVSEEHTVIAANIPVDPITAEKTPRRIYTEKIVRKLQSWLSGLGVLAGIVAVIISPTMLTIGLLVLQVGVLTLFSIIAKPKKPKNWGIVYDATNKKRLDRVIVRLFSKRFDKLVTSDFTDAKGRYAFLVNPNEYYVTYQKPGYEDDRKDVVIQKESDVVSETVALKPKQTE